MSKAIVVGGGPAGVSAALYIKRAKIDVTIIANGIGALEKADRIENYYGFAEPVNGRELVEQGLENARRIGCEIQNDEVLAISWNGNYTVKTRGGEYEAEAVILATGAARNTPNIPGIREYEGKGVSYCAVCDAFFYRGKDVAVLGAGEYALHEAMELAPVVRSVTLLTNGLQPAVALPENITYDARKINSFEGEETIRRVRFADSGSLEIAGVFVAVGVASSSDLAKKLGAEINGNSIVVSPKMETNLPGLFAAGDCTGGLLQISKAVGEGAIAGTEAIKFIRALNQ